jgi:hypothetical protein
MVLQDVNIAELNCLQADLQPPEAGGVLRLPPPCGIGPVEDVSPLGSLEGSIDDEDSASSFVSGAADVLDVSIIETWSGGTANGSLPFPESGDAPWPPFVGGAGGALRTIFGAPTNSVALLRLIQRRAEVVDSSTTSPARKDCSTRPR